LLLLYDVELLKGLEIITLVHVVINVENIETMCMQSTC